MRICGTLLVIAGCLLCISVVWAALGFLLMSMGLICLLIADSRAKRRLADAQRAAKTDQRHEPDLLPPASIEPLRASSAPADALRSPTPSAHGADAEQPGPSSTVRRERAVRSQQPANDTPGYDPARWRSLVANDPDLARSVEVLAPLGKKYVDLLAAAYLVFNEKSYLLTIFNLVAATIEKDTGRILLGVSANRDRQLAASDLKNSPTNDAHFKHTDSPILQGNQPELSGDPAENGKEEAANLTLVDEPHAASGATPVDVGEVKARVHLFDTDEQNNLADLLKKIS